jgi:penicillin-binding protein 1A
LVLLAGAIVFRLFAGYAESRVAARLENEAKKLGIGVRYAELRVGLFPPFRMSDVVFEQTGKAMLRIERLSIHPRIRGSKGFGLLARVAVGRVTLTLPAEFEARINPTSWEADRESALLETPVRGLSFRRGSGPRGQTYDVQADDVSLDALGAIAVEGAVSKSLGVVKGGIHAEGDPRRDFQAAWRFAGFGGETSGSLIVLPGKPAPKTQLQASMKDLDFGHVLGSLGLEVAEGPDSLGSLSGTLSASGMLSDPATLDVIQNLRFIAPKKRPGEVLRVRGDFTHAVTTNSGARKSIEVSPASPDFIAVADVPPLFLRALLIAEDAAFFSHPGIDLTEMPRAVAINMARGGSFRGASTITQQLAKNLYLTREKSLQRKLRELSYSFLLEATIGKQRILEIYLNIIEWGPGLYGLRPAARHYFDKEPQALSPREIAFLVTMIPGPIKYQDSIRDGEVRRGFDTMVNNLLVKLRSVDAISEEEYENARAETLIFRGQPPPEFEAPEVPPIGQ